MSMEHRQRATGISHSPRKPEASCLPIPSLVECTLDCEVMGVHEDTVHLQAEQKKFKDDYKDLNVLLKVNKSDMTGIMEAIEEYLRS